MMIPTLLDEVTKTVSDVRIDAVLREKLNVGQTVLNELKATQIGFKGARNPTKTLQSVMSKQFEESD